jgi:hypothetical protein
MRRAYCLVVLYPLGEPLQAAWHPEAGDFSGAIGVRANRTDYANIQQIGTISFNAKDTSLPGCPAVPNPVAGLAPAR